MNIEVGVYVQNTTYVVHIIAELYVPRLLHSTFLTAPRRNALVGSILSMVDPIPRHLCGERHTKMDWTNEEPCYLCG